ncbi:mandelate racemase/muconate lactonizing enzyme family protein [Jiangella endophytica]|uniref:mandelate racemase/muconate lactonizing enzyme family protein n=1 Tax=Jiangella endophytica TaxID=1623398 RepID=UPI000E344E0B|nr:mandelate racemase/muconate lactonizing enzyme family protein [Jiangella endophytica]
MSRADAPIASVTATVIDLPSRLAGTEIASPMDVFPEHRRRRASWYGSMSGVVVQVAADDAVGVGWTQGGHAVAALVEHHLGPLLTGKDSADVDGLWELARRACYPYGTDGLAAMARSALDLALWDLRGRRSGLPVHRLLGGTGRPLPVYASGNDLEYHQSLGFAASKIGLDHGPCDGDDGVRAVRATIAAARERAGAGHELMADAWMGWTPRFVRLVAPALAEAEVAWLEEPLPPDRPADHAGLVESLGPVRLATGEHLYSIESFARLIDAGVHVLQPDISWCGGLTAARRICDLAHEHGVEVALHLGGGPWGVHLSSAHPACRRAEWYVGSMPGEPLSAEPTIFTGVRYPDSGVISPGEDPGFGVTVDPTELARYRA